MTDMLEKFADDPAPATRGFLFKIVGKLADLSVEKFTKHSGRIDALAENSRGSVARLDKNAQMLESLERRASRHAEHLAKLETRLQALENK